MKVQHYIILLTSVFIIFSHISCKKIKEIDNDPEIKPLQHGFKTSSAIGYCATLAYTYFKNETLPDNVTIHSQIKNPESTSGVLIATINDSYPLPFNSSVGQITIAGIWGGDGGVITAVFTDINIIESKYKFVGVHTIPIIELDAGKIMTLFAEQDIIIGEGSDTLLHINMTNPQIKIETDRLNASKPEDSFAAVKQNVWFVTVEHKNTLSDVYDDKFTIYGGGQIAQVKSKTGGILYHAMIGAKFIPADCQLNPYEGVGFIQNLMIGSETDLGHIFLNFHDRCDGKAYVEFSAGKYLTSNHRNVNLNFN